MGVTITKIDLVSSRRLSQGQERQLQGTKLKVEYELVTTSLAEATSVESTLNDPTKASTFADAFSAALVEKEAASGRAVTITDIVPEAAVVTSKTETVVIAPTPAPGAPGPSPAPPAPPPASDAAEEEESDNGALIGGVVGGVVGVGVLGGAAYMYSKKGNRQE